MIFIICVCFFFLAGWQIHKKTWKTLFTCSLTTHGYITSNSHDISLISLGKILHLRYNTNLHKHTRNFPTILSLVPKSAESGQQLLIQLIFIDFLRIFFFQANMISVKLGDDISNIFKIHTSVTPGFTQA